MLSLRLLFSLLIAIAMSTLCACNSFEKKANAYSKKVLEVGEEYLAVPFGDEKGASIDSPVESSSSYLDDLREISATSRSVKKGLGEVEQGVQSAKEGYAGVKTSIADGVKSVKSSARSLKHKLPRSRKEANQLAYREGEEVMEWLRTEAKELAEKSQLRKDKQR